ncbi:MAG: hypothetical protein JWN68_1747 [Nocardioides sp.]|jgi:GAF domain-containing protein|uniref:GAF domain-containing protein n=1 Tax=Nocardioides sp. TaxID=35761 RepID=UPI002632F4A2|nr:GAF domain-containing protein [Nocardioides sp.]MCW2833794.1 hypothetical protein [Nocardioides sp.]
MSVSLPLADELSAVFARLSGLLLTEETVHTSLGLVARLAHETMPTSVGAGMTLVPQSGQARTAEATDDRVARVDQLQYELGEGPCLAAYAEREVVMVPDTRTDQRFSRWSPAASGMGVVATLSAPLVAGDACLGAMKVYAESPHAFDTRAQGLLPLFADQAAVLLANMQAYEKAERLSEELREALLSRDAISTAKGILMARDHLTEQESLRMLMSMATRENQALRDSAHDVIATVQRRNR